MVVKGVVDAQAIRNVFDGCRVGERVVEALPDRVTDRSSSDVYLACG